MNTKHTTYLPDLLIEKALWEKPRPGFNAGHVSRVLSLHAPEKMVSTYLMEFTCAILAGGKSRRMGTDKATLKFREKALVHHVYDEARKVFSRIIIVSNHHHGILDVDAPVLTDMVPIQGTMVGIVSALMFADTPYVFVLACDMPFVSARALEYMANEAHGEHIIIPRTRDGYEPLHAIYSRSCISYMLTNIERNRLKIGDLFPYLVVKKIEEQPCFFKEGVSIFTNINVKEDLRLERVLNEREAI